MRKSGFIIAAMVLAASCSLDPPEPRTFPQVRLANAASGTAGAAGGVTTHLDQSTTAMTAAISYPGQTDGCPIILVGAHEVAFRQSGNTLATTTGNYELGGVYTVILTNTGAQYRAVQLSDAATITAGNHGLRFVNATGAAGDVYVSPAGAAPDAPYKVVSSLAPLATTNEVPAIVQRPATDVRIRFFDVGTTTTPRADITLGPLFASRLATIVFTPPTGAAGDAGGFQVNPCS
jgi:hypothetical protein